MAVQSLAAASDENQFRVSLSDETGEVRCSNTMNFDPSGLTAYCLNAGSLKTLDGTPSRGGAPGDTVTTMRSLPAAKYSSRPFRAQRGNPPPARETRTMSAPCFGNVSTYTSGRPLFLDTNAMCLPSGDSRPLETCSPTRNGTGSRDPGLLSTKIPSVPRSVSLVDPVAAHAKRPSGVQPIGLKPEFRSTSDIGLVDVDVERNGYGRQLASFEADLDLGDDAEPMRGVFIRAPRVTDAGGDVEVLASHDGVPVLLRQGRFLVASFHPELTGDTRVHENFLELVREESGVRA